MKRVAIVAVGLALVVAMGGSTRGAAQSPPPPATVFQACSVAYPGSVAVTFAWPPTPGALQQWVDLTLSDNGFQPGTFLGGGPVMTSTNTFTWNGIAPELPHFYRVNVLYPDGWVTVASGSFVSIGGCPKPTANVYDLAATQCIGGDFVDAVFWWSPGGGDSQWLDLAESPEAMALGANHAYGPLSADTGSYRLRIPTNASYWWRVNTHSAAGWSPSVVRTFGGMYCAPATPVPPPPAPIPPTPTPAGPPPQGTIDQWTACDKTWWTGANIEGLIELDRPLGLDTSYLERQLQSVQAYVSSYCVGIGVRLASVPGAHEAWCFEMLGYGSTLSSSIDSSHSVGLPTSFLEFAKREVDGFLAAARC